MRGVSPDWAVSQVALVRPVAPASLEEKDFRDHRQETGFPATPVFQERKGSEDTQVAPARRPVLPGRSSPRRETEGTQEPMVSQGSLGREVTRVSLACPVVRDNQVFQDSPTRAKESQAYLVARAAREHLDSPDLKERVGFWDSLARPDRGVMTVDQVSLATPVTLDRTVLKVREETRTVTLETPGPKDSLETPATQVVPAALVSAATMVSQEALGIRDKRDRQEIQGGLDLAVLLGSQGPKV